MSTASDQFIKKDLNTDTNLLSLFYLACKPWDWGLGGTLYDLVQVRA